MSPILIVVTIVLYFGVLMTISHFTSEDSNAGFFMGNRQSPWYVVAFGMIGASLSGVTFISVPGWVAGINFTYMQMVLGYVVGYGVIITVLLPLYYRLNLTSIYAYLGDRLGRNSYKAGAWFFMISRIIGASFRLYLVAMVFDLTIFQKLGWNVPFFAIVIVTIGLIWLYTSKGGMKTIIWTDTLQTAFMLLAVLVTLVMIGSQMNLSIGGMIQTISKSSYSQMFEFADWRDKHFFFKDFLAGAFIAVVMTGLDQDMMQKNLTCKTLGESQKNMAWFSSVLVFVNLLFLALGALLYIYADNQGISIPEKGDELFATIATEGYLGTTVALFFVLGLIAAAYSSADSALTALTTSFSVDILEVNKLSEQAQLKTRKKVHIGISLILAIVIIVFKELNDESVISELFKMAGFTYGPILGLFVFGIYTKKQINDKLVIWVVLAAPILTYFLYKNSAAWFNGYQMGFELLLINGFLALVGLFLISKKDKSTIQK
ncbi:MAG: sodium:solute symporter [Salibacteraceae bacterium]